MTGRLTFTVYPEHLADLEAQIDARVAEFLTEDGMWPRAPQATWHVTTKEVLGGDGSRRVIGYEAEVEVVFP